MENRKKEYLFVDGYNIINSWSMFTSIKNEDLEQCRDKLISVMKEYQAYLGIFIIIVFDGHMVKGNSGTVIKQGKLKVVYTKENETADHYIERSLDEIGRLEKVRVATSDWLEQQIILGRGGTRISARELEMEVLNSKKIIGKKQENKNIKNDIISSRLDEETIRKLNNLFKED